MKLNMGIFDRLIRVAIAVIIAVAYFSGQLTGALGVVALIIAAVLLVTGFVGFCPLYKPLGISTRRKQAA